MPMERCPTTGKIMYPTKRDAKDAVKSLKHLKQYYYCYDCGSYHCSSSRTMYQGPDDKMASDLVALIRSRSDKVRFVARRSNNVSVFVVDLDGVKFRVLYNKKRRTARYLWK